MKQNSTEWFRAIGFYGGALTTIRNKSIRTVHYDQIEGDLAHCSVFDMDNNRTEFPDPSDAIQDFDIFTAYKRIRHAFVSQIEQFQTDGYIAQNGTLIGLFYDLGSNPKHSQSKLITNVKLNLISNKYKSEVCGTFLDLPHNHRNRLEIDLGGHMGHNFCKKKTLPRPIAVRGASLWDVSDHKTPSPIYSNDKKAKARANTTIFGKKLWSKTPKKLFNTPKLVDFDINTEFKYIKKVNFIPDQPPIQIFQALSDSDKQLDSSDDKNPTKTDLQTKTTTENSQLDALDTSIDYENPVAGPSNRPTSNRDFVQQNTSGNGNNPVSDATDTTCKTTFSDFFNQWRLSFIYKGAQLPPIDETNRSTTVNNQSSFTPRDNGWLNIMGDLHRFQSQFQNQFQQLLKEYQTRIIHTENEGTLIPEPARAVLMMNEINILARAIQNNSANFEKFRDHITQCVFGIVSTFFSSEINRPNVTPVDFSNMTATPILSNEILAYLDNARDSLMNLRPFPTSPSPNYNEKETKLLTVIKDFHDGIKPFLDAIAQKFESSKAEVDSILNAPGSSASNTPNFSPPNQSTQIREQNVQFAYKSDGTPPQNDDRSLALSENEAVPNEPTVPSDVLNNQIPTEHPLDGEISPLPSNVLALYDSPGKQVQPQQLQPQQQPPQQPLPPSVTTDQQTVEGANPDLEHIEEIPRSQERPLRIIPVIEIHSSPEKTTNPKKSTGRFCISSDEGDENKPPPTAANTLPLRSRTRKRDRKASCSPGTSKRKKS